MDRYEYRVIPAPRRGEKARGVRTAEDRFAYALSGAMNQLSAEGWEYMRADTLPCDERAGLTGRTTSYHAVLVFRRPLTAAGAGQLHAADPMSADALAADRNGLRAERVDDLPPRSAAPRLGPADRALDDELAAE